MSEVVLIYSLFPNAGEAHDCCRTLLEERLIASANRLAPAVSYFSWEGEVETSEEHPVILKTSQSQAQAAMARIAELHRYKLPAIVVLPTSAAHGPFKDWVKVQTQA